MSASSSSSRPPEAGAATIASTEERAREPLGAPALGVCPVCARPADAPFASLVGVPAHPNVLLPTAAEAVAAPRADVALSLCRGCGLIWNTCFDPRVLTYDAEYENSLHFSAEFNRYADELVDQLIARHDLAGGHVAELGSGKGEFLAQLCERADCSGVGFDPSYDGESDGRADGRVRFVRELARAGQPARPRRRSSSPATSSSISRIRSACSGSYAARWPTATRRSTSRSPRRSISSAEDAVWDVIYPHVTCFSAPALGETLVRAGFHPLRHGYSFGGQYLWMEAASQPPPAGSLPPAAAPEGLDVEAFATRLTQKRADWDERLRRLLAEGPVALWGAGAKGATFLNIVAGGEAIDSVVDVNPRKAGRHVPGTGQRVISPSSLAERDLRAVVVMNPIYAREIEQSLRNLGIRAEVVIA